MILWRVLAEAAKAEHIDRDPDRALEWIRQRLPELFVQPLDEKGKPYRDEAGREVAAPRFKWDQEWPKWQDYCRALLWLAERTRKHPTARTGEDRIPLGVQSVLDE